MTSSLILLNRTWHWFLNSLFSEYASRKSMVNYWKCKTSAVRTKILTSHRVYRYTANTNSNLVHLILFLTSVRVNNKGLKKLNTSLLNALHLLCALTDWWCRLFVFVFLKHQWVELEWGEYSLILVSCPTAVNTLRDGSFDSRLIPVNVAVQPHVLESSQPELKLFPKVDRK